MYEPKPVSMTVGLPAQRRLEGIAPPNDVAAAAPRRSFYPLGRHILTIKGW